MACRIGVSEDQPLTNPNLRQDYHARQQVIQARHSGSGRQRGGMADSDKPNNEEGKKEIPESEEEESSKLWEELSDYEKDAANPYLTDSGRTPTDSGRTPIDTSGTGVGSKATEILRKIERNTAETAESSASTLFWTRIIGLPVAIGFIVGALMAMGKCS